MADVKLFLFGPAGQRLGTDVQYVGPLISEAIRQGYVALVW